MLFESVRVSEIQLKFTESATLTDTNLEEREEANVCFPYYIEKENALLYSLKTQRVLITRPEIGNHTCRLPWWVALSQTWFQLIGGRSIPLTSRFKFESFSVIGLLYLGYL